MIIRNYIVSSFAIFLSVIFIQNCENPLEIKTTDNGIIKDIGLYILKENDTHSWCDLSYSNYDSIDFKRIQGCQDLHCLCYNQYNNLLLTASEDMLYFIDALNNKKAHEIKIPNTINPDPCFSLSEIYLFPYQASSDRCILVNWSIYLVNLKTFNIEKMIWNSRESDKAIYIHNAILSGKGTSLYLLLALLGWWQEGEFWRYEMRQRLSELELETGQMNVIYDYPREDAPGTKFIFCSRDYILSYDLNRKSIMRFSSSSNALIDSFRVAIDNYLTFPYVNDDYIFLQDDKTGSFYKLYPERKEFELYMPFSYQGFKITTYKKMNGGDIYACVPQTSEGKSMIINLSQQKIVREIRSDSIYTIILKGELI